MELPVFGMFAGAPAVPENVTLCCCPGNVHVTDPSEFPPGCKFHPRCPVAIDRCKVENPELREVRPAHLARCHRAEEVEAGTLDLAQAFARVAEVTR